MYDAEVVSEDEFYFWEREGTELYGRGNAILSVHSFFQWLKSANYEDELLFST